ncbi:MAG: alpha/beta hydrolase [Verrucomicrobiae bacterium]|nr:alpha/beta hydrolase [Verrucomicrobiae bacterium]NNJ42251.1 alpha/beta hydrolase [Akkermansiaceae bacterium]
MMIKWKKYLIGEWSWTRPIKSLSFIYLSLLIVALGFSDLIIYQPPTAGYSENDPQIHTAVSSSGIRIGLFHLPAKPGMPTLLWSHGNAEDIGYLADRFQSFHARGYGILAYDYPGYGISEGKPDEDNCYEACQTAWDHLTSQLNVPQDQIIIYGQSVGSGPSVWLASRVDTAGLMLVSPFVSAFRAVTRIPLFPGDRFNNIHRIPDIKTPLLVVHGDQDQVIGPWNGRKLYKLHNGPKKFLNIPNAGHNDIYLVASEPILDALDTLRLNHSHTE